MITKTRKRRKLSRKKIGKIKSIFKYKNKLVSRSGLLKEPGRQAVMQKQMNFVMMQQAHILSGGGSHINAGEEN